MQRGIAFLVFCGLLVTPALAQQDEANKKDMAALRGAWKLVREVESGKEFPASGDETFEFADGLVVNKVKGKVQEELSFKIDPTSKEKAIDLAIVKGKDAGHKLVGIYKLEKDVLVLSLANFESTKRPDSFTSDEKNKNLVLTLKRIK